MVDGTEALYIGHSIKDLGTRDSLIDAADVHVVSAPGEPACDGIGELWFDSDEAMTEALNSAEMAAASSLIA